jgi:lysophospholipid hydrolase
VFDSQIFELNDPEILDIVTDDLCHLFGVDDRSLVQDHIKMYKVLDNCHLVQEGSPDEKLYFVVYGSLKVFQTTHDQYEPDTLKELTLYIAKPGMLTGQLAVLTGEPSFFGVTSLSDSVVACMTPQSFYVIMQKYPHMVLNTAHTVMLRVSPFVRQIDFALDWILVEAGKSVYKQGTFSDCMYIILHGRLRSVHTKDDGKKELVAEYGKGEIVGMVEALKGTARYASLLAIRDTELAKIPEGLLKLIKRNHPLVMTRLISLMSDKWLGNMLTQRGNRRLPAGESLLSAKRSLQEESRIVYGDVLNHLSNLSTVAILPASKDVPLSKFHRKL